MKAVFLLGCYGCIFHGTGNSAQLCQNFGISGEGGLNTANPPPRYATATTHLKWTALGSSLNHSGEKQAIYHPINVTASLPFTRKEVKRNVFWNVMSAGMAQKKGQLFSQTARCHRQENFYSPTKCGLNHDMTSYQPDT